MRLTKEKYWDIRHESNDWSTGTSVETRKGLLRRLTDSTRGRHGVQAGQSYSDFVAYNLLRTHLPVRPDWSAIEIGCAPGINLVDLHRMFGYEPYGVEYSHSGVISTLDTFRRNGFDTANVIEADFFDQEFQDKYRGKFDVVFSKGFIEHFESHEEVLGLHVNLLKTGGYLVCMIPNLLGLFYPFLWLCARDILKAHNCRLMTKSTFRRAFEPLCLDTKFCGRVGAFQFYGSSLKHEHNLRGVVAVLLDRLQDILDHCMFLFHRGSFPESRLSASLLFVGQRIS